MVDVVICASLDTMHLPKSLDNEVGHRGCFAQTEEYETRLWDWKRANIARLLKSSSVLNRRFPRQ